MPPEIEITTSTCRLHDQWKQTVDDATTRHADEIKTLREKGHKVANDVTELHGEFVDIDNELKILTNRIPTDLTDRLIRFEIALNGITKQLTEDFVKRVEFEVLKVEHEQIKKIIYGFVAIVLLAVVGAVVALVVKQ